MSGLGAILRQARLATILMRRDCLWAMFGALSLGLTAQATPAAEDDESDHLGVGQIVVAPLTTRNPDLSIGQQLYQVLTQKSEANRAAPLLRRAITEAARPCHRATAWQLSTSQPQNYTLKVKCTSIRPYAVTVNQAGQIGVSGGDGSVPSMVPEDGQIVTVSEETGEDYALSQSQESAPASLGPPVKLRKEPAPSSTTDVATSATAVTSEVQGIESPTGVDRWLLVAASLGALAVLAGWYRAYRRAQLQPQLQSPPVRGQFSSDAKDELIAVSVEVSPGIFQHPYGWFIAQGPRGKRRLFKRLIWATCYRHFGWKIREIT